MPLVAALLLCAVQSWAGDLRRVERVLDGDTISLDRGEKVRLIGVDTPETGEDHWDRNQTSARRTGKDLGAVRKLGLDAKKYLRNSIEGKRVKLEYEPANASIGHRDTYGRTLAYVYREEDGLFLNAELVKQGYGFAYVRFPFSYLEDFRRYEKEARQNHRGLWA